MRKLTLILLLAISYQLSAISLYVAVPHLINYQGRLTDSQGAPITGTRNITFRIYEQESGGSALWQETHTTSLDKGIFNVMIGGVTALNLAFGSDRGVADRGDRGVGSLHFTLDP